MRKIKIELETASNLFIGGMPSAFEIGGIDQYTVTESEGLPYIPGSSFKGAIRNIIGEEKDDKTANEIKNLYDKYLKDQKEKNKNQIHLLVKEAEAIEHIEKRYVEADKNLSAQYLCGIPGFNNTPKLLFGDFYVCKESDDKDIDSYFSIDMKNSIDYSIDYKDDKKKELVSNPRTYKTARKGLKFKGYITMYNIDHLGKGADKLCAEYMKNIIKKFNSGIYRLGNSKSRGYGKIEIISVTIENEESHV